MNERNDRRPRVPPSPDNAPAPTPRQREREKNPKERGGEIRHILDTGLPPGVRVDEAKDPGSQPPHGTTDDRS